MTDTTALAVRRPSVALVSGYNPPPSEDEFRGMIYMAKQLAEVQGFVPAHFFKQPNKILAAMLYGRDLGITPTNALQHIIVIEGKATADAQLIGMLVRRAGHRLEDKTTDESSTVTITRGDDGSVHTFTFTMVDAKRAGLLRGGSAWEKYPKAMLYARALTACARKGAQDALMGVAYVPEELGVEVAPDGGFTGEIPIEQASTVTQEAAREHGDASVPSPDGPTPEAAQGSSPLAAGPVAEGPTSPVGPSTRRGGRSVGPAPRRTHVITAPQGAEKPTTAPEAPTPTTMSADPVPSQPAPPALTDEVVLPTGVPIDADDGLDQQRELVRLVAAELAHVNAILRNKVEHALKNEPLEVVPPKEPNAASDAGIAQRINIDWPGRTLANLGPEELQNLLERFEASLTKKRALMAERGIAEE